MIDWTKPLRMNDGRKVRRVLCTDRGNESFPVVVEAANGDIYCYTREGRNNGHVTCHLENYSALTGLPVDTLIWVRMHGDNQWVARYFAREQDGYAACWVSGATSKTVDSASRDTQWKLYSLTRPEGCTHWTDKSEAAK